VRAEFLDKIFEIAETDERLIFMTADLGFGVVEKFAERFPDRFINVGVAEQAMIASATGLAEAGMIPYCYSIATFTSLRALEFTRNGPIAHRLPVKVVGVGAGMDYGFDGLTHFAIDDISALRPYPGFLIWAPADADEVTEDLEEIHNDPRPTYIRLLRRGVKSNNRRLHTNPIAKHKIVILSLGDAHSLGSRIATEIQNEEVPVDQISVTRIDDRTLNQIAELLEKVDICVTVESHLITGGLGSIVCEAVATSGLSVKVIRVGVEELPISEHGDAEYLEKRFMTDTERVVEEIIRSIKSK
jgi:transketolase